MKLPSLSFLLGAFVSVCRRFPVPMLIAAIGTVLAMMDIEYKGPLKVDVWLLSAQLGLPLTIGITVLCEAYGWSLLQKTIRLAVGVALVGYYGYSLDPEAPAWQYVHWPRFFGLLAAAHLYVAAAPFFNRGSIADFWEYNKRLFANFIVGAVYALILFAGLSLAILAVNELFDLHIDSKIYLHLFALLAGLFTTSFFLFHFPAEYAFDEQEKAYNAVFRNLCQYILIPIVGLYFLILYAYSIKILVTWRLPHGWVASLVLGFSVAGIFTYLINYLLPDYTDSQLVRAYRRWFWWVLLPMVGLLFAAIGRRIADYGITEERFYVAHAGVWLLVMCGYFLWSKTDNIKFIPISLGLFTLAAVLGPFSAFSVAQRNQLGILHRLLQDNGRFAGDQLKPGGTPVTDTAAVRIISCLEFFENRGALSRVEPWVPIPLQALPEAKGAYDDATQLAAWLNVDLNAGDFGEYHSQKQIIFVNTESQVKQCEIGGFSRFYLVELFESSHPEDQANGQPFFDFSKNHQQLLLKAPGGTTLDTFDLLPRISQWKKDASYNSCELPAGAETFDLQGSSHTARVILQSATISREPLGINNLHASIFLK